MKDFVRETIYKYNTSNPFEVARQLNILVIAEALGKVASYLSPALIHVNSELPPDYQKFAVACQIYHILKNRPGFNFILTNQLDFSNEAVQFGVQFMMPFDEVKSS